MAAILTARRNGGYKRADQTLNGFSSLEWADADRYGTEALRPTDGDTLEADSHPSGGDPYMNFPAKSAVALVNGDAGKDDVTINGVTSVGQASFDGGAGAMTPSS